MQGQREGAGASTAINPLIGGGNATAINRALAQAPSIVLEAGEVLLGRYEVAGPLEVSSGEADLFLLRDTREGDTPCVIKLYRRRFSLNDEIIGRIMTLGSPYIGRVLEAGTLRERAFEIYPYYQNGSLQGRRFSVEQLRETVIPCVNEALRTLHGAGIVHKDIKPSNLMLSGDGERIVVIDFGISTATAQDGADVRTVLGVTPDYAAPEVKYKRYLPASDYYSLGITLYELHFGRTPFQADSPEIYAEAGGRIPIPEGTELSFANLIYGLTEPSADPAREEGRRRWTYGEVAAWCRGRPTPRPYEMARSTTTTEPYTFRDKSYPTVREAFLAFERHWEEGKEQVFRGIALPFYRRFDPRTATLLLRAEDAVRRGEDDDVVFSGLLLALVPEIEGLPWKGKRFRSGEELGRYLIEPMHGKVNTTEKQASAMLSGKMVSAFLRKMGDVKKLSQVVLLEELYERDGEDEHRAAVLCHRLARVLSGDDALRIYAEEVRTGERFLELLLAEVKRSYMSFSATCDTLIDDEGRPRPYLEGWLVEQGLGDRLEMWRRGAKR